MAVAKLVFLMNGKREPPTRENRNFHASILCRFRLARPNEWAMLYFEAKNTEMIPQPNFNSNGTAHYIHRTKRFVTDNDIRRAAQALTSRDEAAQATASNADHLERLHIYPSDPVVPTESESLPTAFALDEEDVREACSSFPRTSGPGPDGISPKLLCLLIYKHDGPEPRRSAPSPLTTYLNILSSGNLPPPQPRVPNTHRVRSPSRNQEGHRKWNSPNRYGPGPPSPC